MPLALMSSGRVKGPCNGSNHCDHIPFFSGSATEVAESEEDNGTNSRISDLEKLRALGLTARQAEVAFWLAQGKSNNDLAVILAASRRTIAHHVEAILERLGLTTRAEIMLGTLEALGWLQWPRQLGRPTDNRLNHNRVRVTSSARLGRSAHRQNSRRRSKSSTNGGKERGGEQ